MAERVPMRVGSNGLPQQMQSGDTIAWANLGLSSAFAQRDLVYANGETGIIDWLNSFADGFNNTAGIDSGNSSNYSTAESGVVKPILADVRITGATPSVSGGGTAANVNDNNTGTTVAWTPGNLAAAAVNSRRFATLDFGSNKTVVMIEAKQSRVSAGAPAADGLYYSTDGSNWTLLGATFAISTTPTDFQRTGSVTARYVAYVVSQTNYSTITATLSDLNAYEAGTPTSVDVRSVSRGINDTPTLVDIFALVEETDALTLNTDFFLHGSRDGNTSYVQGTAAKLGTLANGLSLIAATSISVTGQNSAKNLRWKITSANGKNFKVHAIAVYGRA